MKKKLLAVGVAATLGMAAGVASAQVAVTPTGIGAINLIPYYSVQAGNATLISITNTDTLDGKAVKVRFRGAEWSDDVFDFQVFLSPADVFTAAVTLENGVVKLKTADKSCTLPVETGKNAPNIDFPTFRLDPAKAATGGLEGYVEIITMADIPRGNVGTVDANGDKRVFNEVAEGRDVNGDGDSTDTAVVNPLYAAIKHVNGVAPCGSTVTGLDEDNVVTPVVGTARDFQDFWMTAPSNSLTTSVTIINVPVSKAFTTVATAVNVAGTVKQYFRQANEGIAFNLNQSTDRIFAAKGADVGFRGTALPMFQFDLPDLSTPLAGAFAIGSGTDAVAMRNALTVALSKNVVISEFETKDALLAATDVVMAQPTRRYFYDYVTAASAATPDRIINAGNYDVYGEAATPFEALDGGTNRIPVQSAQFFDREENTLVQADDIVISPTPPTAQLKFSLKGEVSVVSINNGGVPSGALSAALTADDYTANGPSGVFDNGWAILSTTSSGCALTDTTCSGSLLVGYGSGNAAAIPPIAVTRTVTGSASRFPLPVIGYTAINVFNGGVGSAGTNYGLTYPLRFE